MELDIGVIIAQILIPTIGSVIAVWKIGNKIKDALCNQINALTIELRTHIGVSVASVEDLEKLKNQLTNVILKNNLKI